MNAEQFSSALGKVNDKYIMETITYERKKKNSGLKWGAMAACLCLILTAAMVMLPGILNSPGDVVPPNPDSQQEEPVREPDVAYQALSLDWPVYESADELIEACDVVFVGTVTNISFQVLDTRTGKAAEAETEDLYRSLYTIYDMDIIETYKGDSKDKEQVRVIGGLEGAYVTEQLAALGQEQATILILKGLIEIREGGTYLFMLNQYEDTLPTIVNPWQGIYNISDAHSNGSKQDGEITVQEIISSFGTNEWRKFESGFDLDEPN